MRKPFAILLIVLALLFGAAVIVTATVVSDTLENQREGLLEQARRTGLSLEQQQIRFADEMQSLVKLGLFDGFLDRETPDARPPTRSSGSTCATSTPSAG